MAFLAGERVTAGRINRLQPRVYNAIGSGTVAGPATNTAVPDATLTITTEVDGATYTAVCTWDVDLTGATTSLGTARLVMDGTAMNPLATFAQEVTTDRLTVSQTYSSTLDTAGSHTLKLVASPATNQTIQGANCAITVTVYEVA